MNDIVLTPITVDDLEMVRNWRNSPEVSKYMYTENYITAEEQQSWFSRISNNSNCEYFVISYKGQKIGLASLTEISKTFDSCFWAFYLGDQKVRGGGIGSKIEYNILHYVFDILKLNKLRCEVLVDNTTVITMHQKFGFRREAYYREHVKKGNQYFDVVGLAMLRKEWEQLRDYHYNRIYNR